MAEIKRQAIPKTNRKSAPKYLSAPVQSPNIRNMRWVNWLLQAEDFAAIVAAASPAVVVPAQEGWWQRFRWERALDAKVTIYIGQWQRSLRSRPSEIEQWATQLAGYARSTLYALGADFSTDGPPTIPLDAVRALRDGSSSEQAVAQSRWLAPPDGLPDRRRFGEDSFLPTFLELGVSIRDKSRRADKHVTPVPVIGPYGSRTIDWICICTPTVNPTTIVSNRAHPARMVLGPGGL